MITTGRCLLPINIQTKCGFPKAYTGESSSFSVAASGGEMLGSGQRGQEEKQHLWEHPLHLESSTHKWFGWEGTLNLI